jgi:hypothetical protein
MPVGNALEGPPWVLSENRIWFAANASHGRKSLDISPGW